MHYDTECGLTKFISGGYNKISTFTHTHSHTYTYIFLSFSLTLLFPLFLTVCTSKLKRSNKKVINSRLWNFGIGYNYHRLKKDRRLLRHLVRLKTKNKNRNKDFSLFM